MPRRTLVFALLTAALVLGCLPQSRAPEPYKEYLISYDPPAWETRDRPATEQAVKVNRFATAAPVRDPLLVVRTGPHTVQALAYHAWRATPGEMVGELLTRDMRDSGLFSAVFSSHEISEADARLDGLVEDFSEHREGGARIAVLKVRLTLLYTGLDASGERTLFQKLYTETEPVSSPGAEGLARAMSLAVKRFSRKAVGDVYESLRGD